MTNKEKVIKFVASKGEASFTDIQRYLVDDKFGIGTYDGDKKKYRGYYTSLFSKINGVGGELFKGESRLYKNALGKYKIQQDIVSQKITMSSIYGVLGNDILDVKSTHFANLPDCNISHKHEDLPIYKKAVTLNDIYNEVISLGSKDKCSISEKVCKFLEETGEFIREINKTTGRKTTNETPQVVQDNILEEAADTLKNLLLIISSFNISIDSLLNMIKTKNLKWESKITERQNFVKNKKNIITVDNLRTNGWEFNADSIFGNHWGKGKNDCFDYFQFIFNMDTGYVSFENMLSRKVETIEQLEQYYNALK